MVLFSRQPNPKIGCSRLGKLFPKEGSKTKARGTPNKFPSYPTKGHQVVPIPSTWRPPRLFGCNSITHVVPIKCGTFWKVLSEGSDPSCVIQHHSSRDRCLCPMCKLWPYLGYRRIEVEQTSICQQMTSEGNSTLCAGINYSDGVLEPRVTFGVSISGPHVNDRLSFVSNANRCS